MKILYFFLCSIFSVLIYGTDKLIGYKYSHINDGNVKDILNIVLSQFRLFNELIMGNSLINLWYDSLQYLQGKT